MAKHIISCKAKCPYYKAHERQEIYCVGPEEGSSIHVAWAVPTMRKTWMGQYCLSEHGFEGCPVYEALEALGR